MVSNLDSATDKLRQLIRRHTPFSILDLGVSYATGGQVLECSRSGSVISGTVRDRNEDLFSAVPDRARPHPHLPPKQLCSQVKPVE